MIQNGITQFSPYRHLIRTGPDLLDDNFSLFQVQGTDVRFILWKIQILLHGKLYDSGSFYPVHMYISLDQLHNKRPPYIQIYLYI